MQGKIDLSICMMPRAIAEELSNIAGIGRGQPNQNPHLPPPNRAAQTYQAKKRSSLLSIGRGPRAGSDSELGFSSALTGVDRGVMVGLVADQPGAARSLLPAAHAGQPTTGGRRGWLGGKKGADTAVVVDPAADAAAAAGDGSKKRRSLLGRLKKGKSADARLESGGMYEDGVDII